MDLIFYTDGCTFRRGRNFSIVLVALWMVCSTCVSAYDSIPGPRMEIGGGISAHRMQSRPNWSSKYYSTGIGTCAFRLYRGLYIQGGAEYGFGNLLRPEWLDYSENVRLKTEKGTYEEVTWLGVRYIVPASTFNIDFMGIQFVQTSLGIMYSRFGIRSSTWEEGENVEEDERERRFETARVSGPFIALAGRWQFNFDNIEEQEIDSWRGAYGFDIGVRYVRYNSSSTRYGSIMAPKSNFKCFQVYIIGFLRIKFLY